MKIVGSAMLNAAVFAAGVFAIVHSCFAQGQRIENPIAVFAALNKVTGRISHLEIPLNETTAFGALRVTPRACYTRPPTEPPNTTGFIEVDEVKLDGEQQRIFTGWMYAESPGLHAVEHPVFDVWLTSCKTSAADEPVESAPKDPEPDNDESNSR